MNKLALEKRLLTNLTTLEPVAKDVPLKTKTSQVPQSDGSVSVQVSSENGDRFMDKQEAKAIAKSIADALDGLIPSNRVYRKDTSPVSIDGYIDPSWAPTYLAALEISIQTEEGEFAQVVLGALDGQQTTAAVTKMYLGFTLDGTAVSDNISDIHYEDQVGQISVPLQLVWTIGPLSKGTHVIRPWAAKFQTGDANWSCRWPFCQVLVFGGTAIA